MNELLDQLNNILPYAKGVSVILTVLFFGSAVFFAIKSQWLPTLLFRINAVGRSAPHAKKRVVKAWKMVLDYLGEENPHAWKLAILQADTLLDEALRAAGTIGKNTGERLKAIDRTILPNLDEVWNAHRLRNEIAHHTELEIDRTTAERAIKTYEEAFKHLGLID